jgi:hypothetical protein
MENCFAVEPCYCVILWFFQGFGSRKPNGELELWLLYLFPLKNMLCSGVPLRSIGPLSASQAGEPNNSFVDLFDSLLIFKELLSSSLS